MEATPTVPIRTDAIGLMGGTFDPIHFGHLLVAEQARERYQLGEVIFVPNDIPPHKKDYEVSSAEHRYAMAVIATADNPYFRVSREEIDRPGPSYSIDTIRAFRQQLGPEVRLYFITGADAILDILTWRQPQDIVAECQLIAAHRPGFDLQQMAAVLGAELAKQVEMFTMPALDISSTVIRQRVMQGQSIRYLTVPSVVNYIHKAGLYQNHRSDRGKYEE